MSKLSNLMFEGPLTSYSSECRAVNYVNKHIFSLFDTSSSARCIKDLVFNMRCFSGKYFAMSYAAFDFEGTLMYSELSLSYLEHSAVIRSDKSPG